MREDMESYRESFSEESGRKISINEVLESLELAELDVSFHLETDSQETGYLKFISRNWPGLNADSKGSGIIITG
jgi:hypothetical protein